MGWVSAAVLALIPLSDVIDSHETGLILLWLLASQMRSYLNVIFYIEVIRS
jgi:hypothetical protein